MFEITDIERAVIEQVVAIGQEKIFANLSEKAHRKLLDRLVQMDRFYREMGGIVGYQAKILELLNGSLSQDASLEERLYHSPHFFDIAEEKKEVREAAQAGLRHLGQMAEIYPLGGAADRLHLVDEKSGEELPAAKLPFAGFLLLEHLIRDLSAREYLYYQIFGEQLTTPLAMMTSEEKDNHMHVLQICEEKRWFGRPKESMRTFIQPLVPAVDHEGNWCMTPQGPLFKPGGHGALWKQAKDSGIFEWLLGLGRKKALIRQINNPLAGLDYGLLAFCGLGCQKGMIFGFASCPRLLKAAEGVNVLIERNETLVLTNVEYCDFAKFGISDLPLKEGEPYSRFSSNTNILFADLQVVASAVDTCPFPGLLVNLKKSTYQSESGEKKEQVIARLESTMQNIADIFVEPKREALETERTYITYNRRHKTISAAKKAYIPGMALQETPENCFYDLLTAHRELLEACGFAMPPQRLLEEYLALGPEFVFLYHPALGPLYSLIREKLQGGSVGLGSELIFEIAAVKAKNLHVQGSLRVLAEQPMGHFEKGHLRYSDQIGRCVLENVRIENEGVDWDKSAPFWKMNVHRKESVTIFLKGNSEFIAKDIHLKGSHTFVVEDGQSLKI